ncbi:ESX secretion-associated protein EspG [Saccharopolyspora flava]|uniref:EspG family protein n=1 Tax=Saccharopolyspora flava TaxID=95161 RepID=A0A1I6V5M5_9PSEU|nr:ESX secretion-associated protein EspG [Saccharopolyspora flava]SFT08952.1 EspG family protein [Saccharopolyspora flava]
MTNPDFVLSAAEFDLLFAALELGRPPYPLQVPSLGTTMRERAERTEEAFRELARRGLATDGELDPRLASALRLLVDHDAAVDAVGHRDGPIRALAAVNHRSGVVAELVGEELRLTEIRPTALALSAVAVLPPSEPGQQRAISVPADALEKALAEDDDDPFGGDVEEDVALVKAGLSPQEAAVVLDLAHTRRAGGQFGVSRGTRRATTLVTWFDTDQGRYLMVGKDAWLSIAPADNKKIEHRLADVLAEAA